MDRVENSDLFFPRTFSHKTKRERKRKRKRKCGGNTWRSYSKSYQNVGRLHCFSRVWFAQNAQHSSFVRSFVRAPWLVNEWNLRMSVWVECDEWSLVGSGYVDFLPSGIACKDSICTLGVLKFWISFFFQIGFKW